MANNYQKAGVIKPQKVCYDLKTKTIVDEKINQDTVCFDSKSEYETYLILDAAFPCERFDIAIHKQVRTPGCNWKLDFTVTPKRLDLKECELLTQIAQKINDCSIAIPIISLYIEYKGVKDKNFVEKMKSIKTLQPELSKQIILCSAYDDAFGYWSDVLQKIVCHPIIASRNLKAIIQGVVSNG